SIEHEPGDHEASQRHDCGQEPAEDAAARPAFLRRGFQAGGAEKPRLVLGDTFAAERADTTRAAAGGFPVRVIPAALLNGRAGHEEGPFFMISGGRRLARRWPLR